MPGMIRALETIQRPVADALAEAVRVFDAELESQQPFVREMCAQAASYRGKMLRPTLLLLSASATGGIEREHVVLAAVVEMVHVATLVHDDVLDEANERRGAATIRRTDGNEAAVLLGDYLISHSFHLCTSIGSAEAARRVAAATNRVCEGELTQVHHRGDWGMGEETYYEIIRGKTAALTRAACELGAMSWKRGAAARPEAWRAALADYGERVGMAFQIIDDVLDITSSEDEMGKTLGRDAELGKPTLPVIHALATAAGDERAELVAMLAKESRGGQGAGRSHMNSAMELRNELRARLQGSGSLEYAMEGARRQARSALEGLAALPETAAREALRAAAEFTLERRK